MIRFAKLRMMKRDSVKPPGTLVRIEAKPEAVPEVCATPTSCSMEEIFFLCVLPFYCMPAQREKVNQRCCVRDDVRIYMSVVCVLVP